MSDEKTLEQLLENPFEHKTPSAPLADQPASAMQQLSAERQEQARQLAKQIDERDSQTVITYGAQAQQKLTEFSQSMLDHVQNKDTNGIGDSLTSLMYKLNEANPAELRADDNNLFRKLFGKVKQSIYETTAKYQKIGAQVDAIATKLDSEKNSLIQDNETLEVLYQKNKDYFDALSLYIAAGELKLAELNDVTIPTALQEAQTSGNQMKMQEVTDLQQFAERLDKRTHDLKLTRQMTIQQAPQIRLIQNTNQALAEKIQSSIHTAIPLWKNQIAIALTLLRQKNAVTAQRQVSQTTNDLLQKNSELLKISTLETARENERGVIDLETLKKTQENLIQTLEETLRIQKDGRDKRRLAEQELHQMEHTLRERLLLLTQQEKELLQQKQTPTSDE